MTKLLVLQGIPCSGKSTWAREFVSGKKDWVIVNRDSLRSMRGDYWIPEQEDFITVLEDYAVQSALKSGLSVIVDATNLNPKTISRLEIIATTHSAVLETKLFKIDLKEAIRRDIIRGEKGGISVGKKVIENFYYKYPIVQDLVDDRYYLGQDEHKPKCVIVDIDGTLALRNGRNPFDYGKVLEDRFNHPVGKLLIHLDLDNIEIIFVSGRENKTLEAGVTVMDLTSTWLGHFGCKGRQLFLRKEGDMRSDDIVKREIFEDHIKPNYNVIAVLDDRDKVVKMWRDLGLLCLQVYYGDF